MEAVVEGALLPKRVPGRNRYLLKACQGADCSVAFNMDFAVIRMLQGRVRRAAARGVPLEGWLPPR
eukprot:9728414-Alexandrium_andersonii.AAC.1